MKQLLLLNIILAALITPAQAASVNAYASVVLGTYGSFSSTPGSTALKNDEIASIFNNNITSLKGTPPPASISTIFGLSNPITGTTPLQNWSSIDLGFGDKNVVTGTGVDLVVISLWSGFDYIFGLQAFGNDGTFDNDGNLLSDGTLLSNYMYRVNPITDDPVADPVTSYNLSPGTDIYTTSIDLFDNLFDNNGVDISSALADDIELGYIRLFIGNDFNGDLNAGGNNAYANISLVGAFHTQTAVVPLPLPIILFSSGLALLGWIGRRKTT